MKRALIASFCAVIVSLLLSAQQSADAAERYKLKFATLAPEGTPWSDVLDDFKKRVEKQTDKSIRVKTYLNGILGDERAMLELMKFEKITGGGFTSGGISTVVPELQIVELPYLFRNYEEIDYILDEVLWKEMQQRFEAQGIYLYSWAENGWLDFGFTNKRVDNWEALKGQKAFAQESDVAIATLEALGAVPVPLAVPDVLSNLQTGLITAYSTTPIYGIAGQWFTQTKYWWDTGHIYQPAAVVFDLQFWNKLPEEYKKIILGFRDELQSTARTRVRGIDDGILKGFAEQGIEVIPMSDAERAKMSNVSEAVAKKLIDKGVFKQELWDKVKKSLAEFRARKK